MQQNGKAEYPVASKIIDVRVDWMDGWGNDPHWNVLLDSPKHPEFFAWDTVKNPVQTWEHRDGLWRAESGIFVNFKAYSRPGDGYGGQSYPVIDTDGRKTIMKGPWSSRAGCANAIFPGHERCVEFSTPYSHTPEGLKQEWSRARFGGIGGVAIQAKVLIQWLRDNDWFCQHVHTTLDDEGRRTDELKLSREKVRVGWQTSRGEPVLIPLHYATGKPKNELIDGESLEEVT